MSDQNLKYKNTLDHTLNQRLPPCNVYERKSLIRNDNTQSIKLKESVFISRNCVKAQSNRRNTVFDMRLGIMKERDKFDTDNVMMRNIDTKLINKKGVSYNKMIERNSLSKARRTLMSLGTIDAPLSLLKSNLILDESNNCVLHESISLAKVSNDKKIDDHILLKDAIKQIYKSNIIESQRLSIGEKMLRKSRQEYLDYLICMRVFKQGILSLFCKSIVKLIDEGIEHRPDLWKKTC